MYRYGLWLGRNLGRTLTIRSYLLGLQGICHTCWIPSVWELPRTPNSSFWPLTPTTVGFSLQNAQEQAPFQHHRVTVPPANHRLLLQSIFFPAPFMLGFTYVVIHYLLEENWIPGFAKHPNASRKHRAADNSIHAHHHFHWKMTGWPETTRLSLPSFLFTTGRSMLTSSCTGLLRGVGDFCHSPHAHLQWCTVNGKPLMSVLIFLYAFPCYTWLAEASRRKTRRT